MEVTRLRTLHMEDPLGIDAVPYFSWNLTSEKNNVLQEKYQIRVADADGNCVWDSGERLSGESSFVPYEGKALQSRTQYTWTVNASSNQGESAEASGSFETAMLGDTAWTACWAESPFPVTERKSGFGNQPAPTMFRRELEVRGALASARVYATARGVYQLYLNGQRADGQELAPGYAAYDAIMPYQTFDVTSFLQNGKNCIGFYVGDGWYFNQETAIHKDETKCGAHAICFALYLNYADGSQEVILADDQVKAAAGPVIFSDFFAGERYDARQEKAGWSAAGYDDSAWIPAKPAPAGSAAFIAAPDDKIVPIKSFPVKKLFTTPEGDLIADFGQNMAGRVRITGTFPADMTIALEHFEALDANGNYFNTIMSTNGVGAGADQKTEFISDGNAADWAPCFTYLGFRYVRIRFYDGEGRELTGSGRPAFNEENLCAEALSTKKENLGSFACSDERLNRLYENIRWSQNSNMVSIPTDCPQREKAGWTGDAGIYIETALLNEDVTPLFTRYLASMAADQQPDGAVPMVVPFNETYRFMSQMMAQMSGLSGHVAPAGWGDASVKIPWTMYQVTGNKEILRSSYGMMRSWCDYIIRTAEVCGRPELPAEKECYLWDTGFHYGEWLIPSTSKDGFADQQATGMAMMMTARYVAPIFGYVSVRTLAEAAELLGFTEDAAHYGDVAEKMKDAIQTCLVGPDGEAPAEYMGAYVLMLYFDLVPQQWKKKYEYRLLAMIEENDGCLDTGFLGTPYILETLEKTGHLDAAYDLLFQTKSPSWLYEVEHGATTIWETWNAVGQDGTPQNVSMNHYSFGCVAEWMFRNIGGIQAEAPGFEKIRISPKPDARLDWAERSYMSEHGLVRCAWKRAADGIEIEVTIPCGAKAEVILPNGECFEAGSGSYRCTC